tara:strand:- start:1537 stop:2292 length:756 start_codon:yes stop_codon:yes gene_type:complete
MRAYSTVKKNFYYGAPGLGDRVHSVLLCYNYGITENTQVMLHLTKYQWNRHKPESWPEILSLFPKGSVAIMPHLEYEPVSNQDFVEYVRQRGYTNAEGQIYGDYPQRFEPTEGIDLTKYLKHFPQLSAEDCNIDLNLPEKFITVQWDSTSKRRSMDVSWQAKILSNYKDYEVITVGGQANNELLKNSLKHIAYAMTKAKYHVGIDSGFLHLSQVYFAPEDIHIYTTSHPNKWSHHMHRAKDNGIRINENRS